MTKGKKKAKPRKKNNEEKADPPGTPMRDMSKEGCNGKNNGDEAISKSKGKLNDENDDDLEDEEIRKHMEEEGCGHMSVRVREWLESWRHSPTKNKRRKVSVTPTEASDDLDEKGLSDTGVVVEESSADDSKDDDSGIPINVETNVEGGEEEEVCHLHPHPVTITA